jgi:cytoskeletal protein CcmA (bactofilin family)
MKLGGFMIKKDKKRPQTESSTISTLLGRDTQIEGTLTFQETIRIDGGVKGKLISSKGTVIVGENAAIDAEIRVGVAIIRGKITGKVEAGQRIEIYAPAQVNGDISAPTITIDSGVIFNGQCQMQPRGDSARRPVDKQPSGAAVKPPQEGGSGAEKDAKNL